MNSEHDFYREIRDIAPVPHDLFVNIDRRIRRRAIINRSVAGLAASLIISIGLLIIMPNRQMVSATSTVQPEITAELQIVHDYLNAGDIEEELALYSVIDSY